MREPYEPLARASLLPSFPFITRETPDAQRLVHVSLEEWEKKMKNARLWLAQTYIPSIHEKEDKRRWADRLCTFFSWDGCRFGTVCLNSFPFLSSLSFLLHGLDHESLTDHGKERERKGKDNKR